MRWFLGVIIFMGLVFVTVSLTGWGPEDPGYWGMMLLGAPVSMILSAFFPENKE